MQPAPRVPSSGLWLRLPIFFVCVLSMRQVLNEKATNREELYRESHRVKVAQQSELKRVRLEDKARKQQQLEAAGAFAVVVGWLGMWAGWERWLEFASVCHSPFCMAAL